MIGGLSQGRLEMPGDDGLLPLHRAVKKQAPVEVVLALLGAYPQAAAVKDGEGMLPLHDAARWQAPVAVVKALLGAHPQARTHVQGCTAMSISGCGVGTIIAVFVKIELTT